MTTPSIVEFFPFHKKETDLAIGEAVETPPPDHPFNAGYRLYNDSEQLTGPTTPKKLQLNIGRKSTISLAPSVGTTVPLQIN